MQFHFQFQRNVYQVCCSYCSQQFALLSQQSFVQLEAFGQWVRYTHYNTCTVSTYRNAICNSIRQLVYHNKKCCHSTCKWFLFMLSLLYLPTRIQVGSFILSAHSGGVFYFLRPLRLDFLCSLPTQVKPCIFSAHSHPSCPTSLT